MSSLERAVEVDADSIAGDSWVLVGQREDERGVITEANSTLAYTQAALGLAEKHHVWWEREVVVVFQRIATEELRCLGYSVTTWLPVGEMDKNLFLKQQRLFLCCTHNWLYVVE